MKQASLFSYTTKGGLPSELQVVDLFCGIGGFSHGAKLAGHRVVLAVDQDPRLLDAHRRNNPRCQHVCCTLPADDLPMDDIRGPWHLHASPPCTKLSIMKPHQYAHERREAIDLVAWYFDLVQRKRPTSWSMEQVNHAAIRERLTRLKAERPLLFDWVVVDAVDHGVPQNRKRIVAGSPSVISNLRHPSKQKRKRCVLDVIPDPPTKFVRNCLYSRPDQKTKEYVEVPLEDKIRSVEKPCYTVLATGHKRWSDAEGNVLRHLTGEEAALIQSFPPDYRLPSSRVASLIGVGNALPPLLAKSFMRPTSRPA